MDKFTGVRFDTATGEFEAVVVGDVEAWASTARDAAVRLQEAILWRAATVAHAQQRSQESACDRSNGSPKHGADRASVSAF